MIENHAVLPPPLLKDVWRAGLLLTQEQAKQKWYELHEQRSRCILEEKEDPLRCGWEPPIWAIADALLGLKLNPIGWEKFSGMNWTDWSEATRVALGFSEPLDLLLVSGVNRGSKSEYAAKRLVQQCLLHDNFNAWAFHDSEDVSRDQQQKLVWKYLPADMKSLIRTSTTYIAYKEQTGFAGNHIILENGSTIGFRFYKQDLKSHEGANLNWIWPDELIGPELLETLLSRLATTRGKMVPTFTPIMGWTATVQMILQGAEITKESTAFFIPTDGGEPDVPRGLGFSSQQAMEEAHKTERWSIPENCIGWHRGDSGQPAIPEGRTFAKMPRVMRCSRRGWGCIFYHPMDNPYGNPLQVWKLWRDSNAEQIERRIYGFARKAFCAQFPSFDKDFHVIKSEDIPTEGTDIFFMDPTAGGRPFVLGWFRACKGRLYMIREWPDQSHVIPSLGVLGSWAISSGARDGLNDGKKGPAQSPIGWGLRQYLLEIGRIEGWTDSDMDKVLNWTPIPESGDLDDDEEIDRHKLKRRLPPTHGRQEDTTELGSGSKHFRVQYRYIDCRASSAMRIENDRARTLLTDFSEWGLEFELTSGGEIIDKVARVNDLLSFDKKSPSSFFNSPRLYFSDKCRNTIWSMQNWQNADGQKGACKDFADLVLWAADLECEKL